MRLPEVLMVVPQTKGEVSATAQYIIDYVCEDGTLNALDAEIMLKQVSKVIEAIRDNEEYKKALDKELGKYNADRFEYQHFKITKKSTSKYKYDSDSVWNEYEAKKKGREAFLKNLTEPVANPETGEMIYPAVKSSTSYITIEPNS